MVVGGIAIIAHGVQRMTSNIDAVIQGDAVAVRVVIDASQAQDHASQGTTSIDAASETSVDRTVISRDMRKSTLPVPS